MMRYLVLISTCFLLLFSRGKAQLVTQLEENEVHKYEQPAPHDRLITFRHTLRITIFFMRDGDPLPIKVANKFIRIDSGQVSVYLLDIIQKDLARNWRTLVGEGLYIFDLIPDSSGIIAEAKPILVDEERSYGIMTHLLASQKTFATKVEMLKGTLDAIRVNIIRQKMIVEETRLDGSPLEPGQK